jgi:hypothetical protein
LNPVHRQGYIATLASRWRYRAWRRTGKLTKNAKPGKLFDGDGLYLPVRQQPRNSGG